MLRLDETRTNSGVDYDAKVRGLETRCGKLEFEKDQLLLCVENTRERHKEELAALESSHK